MPRPARRPPSRSASRYLADVPKQRHAAPRRRGRTARAGAGWNGEPSKSRASRRDARPRRQPVPHHPAAGGEVEDPVAGLHVAVQRCSFRCCSSVPPAPWTMHFGTPGRARRVEDVERVVEGQRARTRARPARRGRGTRSQATRAAAAATSGVADRRGQGRPPPCATDGSALEDLGDACRAIGMRLAAVPVAVDGEEHRRLDLAEAVEHAAARRSPASTTTRSRRGSRRASMATTVSGRFGRSRRRGRRARTPCGAQRRRRRARPHACSSRVRAARRMTLSSPLNTIARRLVRRRGAAGSRRN